MSSTYVVIVLCIVVALLILMVGKLKFHAILALLIATITLGILVGTPLEKIPSTLNSGFGSTCTSVALVIFLGSLLGLILSETGAIVKLTTSLVDFCGKKRVLWAIGTSACILGIPVFPDTVSLLTIPALYKPGAADRNLHDGICSCYSGQYRDKFPGSADSWPGCRCCYSRSFSR